MTTPHADPARTDATPAAGLCPFLRSREGDWTSSHASRELRCWAVRPAAQPAIAKQRGLCLLSAHAACATFVAASSGEAATTRPRAVASDLWPATRNVPVALEPVRGRASIPVASPRTGGQALLIGLMVLAFLVLVIARTSAPGSSAGSPAASLPASAGASAGASLPGAIVSPSVAGSPSPAVASPGPSDVTSSSAAASASPAARPTRSPGASATPLPSGTRTYTIQKNDTLATIAARYHTTVKALAAANGITDSRLIHVGQVLVIP
jgi:LysM repeat protein